MAAPALLALLPMAMQMLKERQGALGSAYSGDQQPQQGGMGGSSAPNMMGGLFGGQKNQPQQPMYADNMQQPYGQQGGNMNRFFGGNTYG